MPLSVSLLGLGLSPLLGSSARPYIQSSSVPFMAVKIPVILKLFIIKSDDDDSLFTLPGVSKSSKRSILKKFFMEVQNMVTQQAVNRTTSKLMQ